MKTHEISRDKIEAILYSFAGEHGCSTNEAIDAILAALTDATADLRAEVAGLQRTITGCEEEVAKVYCELTNNRFSKMNTRAEFVIAAAQEIQEAEVAGLREDKERLEKEVLDEVDDRARQACSTGKVDRDYLGQVAGTLVTDSGAISGNAQDLRRLADAGRFRIVGETGRMVVGYWPENDPEHRAALDAAKEDALFPPLPDAALAQKESP